MCLKKTQIYSKTISRRQPDHTIHREQIQKSMVLAAVTIFKPNQKVTVYFEKNQCTLTKQKMKCTSPEVFANTVRPSPFGVFGDFQFTRSGSSLYFEIFKHALTDSFENRRTTICATFAFSYYGSTAFDILCGICPCYRLRLNHCTRVSAIVLQLGKIPERNEN